VKITLEYATIPTGRVELQPVERICRLRSDEEPTETTLEYISGGDNLFADPRMMEWREEEDDDKVFYATPCFRLGIGAYLKLTYQKKYELLLEYRNNTLQTHENTSFCQVIVRERTFLLERI